MKCSEKASITALEPWTLWDAHLLTPALLTGRLARLPPMDCRAWMTSCTFTFQLPEPSRTSPQLLQVIGGLVGELYKFKMKVTTNWVYHMWDFLGSYMYQLCLFLLLLFLVFFLRLQQACFDIFLFKNSMSLFRLPFLIFSGQRKRLFERAFMQWASKSLISSELATRGTLLVSLQISSLVVASR